MKLISFFSFLYFLLGPNDCIGQEKPVKFGIQAGTALSPVKNELHGVHLFPEPQASLMVTYAFNEKFSLSLEPGYTRRTRTYRLEETSSLLGTLKPFLSELIDTTFFSLAAGYINDSVYTSREGMDKMGFIELPLLCTYRLGPFFFQAGPYAAITINSRSREEINTNIPLLDFISPALDSLGFTGYIIRNYVKGMYPGYGDPYLKELDNRSDLIDVDFGIKAGAGYNFTDRFFLNLCYSMGLRNYRTNTLKDNDRLQAAQITLGYRF